jgi:glycosyltransferase involved in cell wall biosynthesis
MKIVFANRSDCFINKGGDTTQMVLTKKYLETHFNLEISICLQPEELLSTHCDLVHIFNVQTNLQTRAFIASAKSKNIKIVLTPIYWNLKYSMFQIGLSKLHIFKPTTFHEIICAPCSKLYNLVKPGSYLSRRYKKNIKSLIEQADIVLPNADEERDIITKHFNISVHHSFSVVPNATEPLTGFPASPVIRNKNSVLQVGLISPSKNQLGTLLALYHKPEIPLYFIGRVLDKQYFNHLLKLATARGNVFFIDEMAPEELASHYRQCAVHVLPSFRESPGLVTLEAFQFGCEIVVSDSRFVPVSYYRFNEIAHICNPYDIHSIDTAIREALCNPKQPMINTDKYFSFFNYETVARKTYEAYQSIL